jgi:hypothetical protein
MHLVRCPGCRHQCRLLHAQPTQVAAAGAPAPSSGVQEQGRLLTLCSSRGGRRRHRSQNWQRQRWYVMLRQSVIISVAGRGSPSFESAGPDPPLRSTDLRMCTLPPCPHCLTRFLFCPYPFLRGAV